ncbi:Olfactory receptor 7C2 [Galemys pyrenaicus]|uniref:Olfactory receptor 7C2 n=1 Tax=Galemys pyrenaicus TaxID=202257 RepID=A0A8J6AHH0_GALPY|nr:Olfactory receptor 7C2 [Galemys pyrenaicus]
MRKWAHLSWDTGLNGGVMRMPELQNCEDQQTEMRGPTDSTSERSSSREEYRITNPESESTLGVGAVCGLWLRPQSEKARKPDDSWRETADAVGMRKWAHLSLDTGLYGRCHEDASTDQQREHQQAAVRAVRERRSSKAAERVCLSSWGMWSEFCVALSLLLGKPSSPMERRNQTGNFLLLGFAKDPHLQPLLFGLFLSMYLVTFTGNLLIFSDSHLHTPMYFFLSNLSFADFCFTSTTIPKMLLNLQTQSRVISYADCLSQIFFSIVFGCLDNLLLTVMAYDRFVAICNPLHYMVIMNPRLCGLLALGSWCISVMGSLLETLTLLRLSFCTNMEIPHFFCDLPEVLKLACSDTLLNNIVVYFVTIILGVFPLSGILFSYSQIFSSILRMSSAAGKYKAFSTCGSHLCVVSLFYGTGLGVYLSSAATSSSTTGMMASVMYTMVTPMLNPFIYSLRNRDMKGALGRLLSKVKPLRGGPSQDPRE